MQRIAHITLAILLIWSTSGLQIARHYCMGSLRTAGWYSADACPSEPEAHIHSKGQKTSPGSETSLTAIPCCDDEADWIQTDEPFVTSRLADIQPPLANSYLLTHSIVGFYQNTNLPFSTRGPPLIREIDRLIEFQVFRL